MNIKELRSGSIVMCGAQTYTVEIIDSTTIWGDTIKRSESQYHLNIENVSPVVITEDWLRDLGCRQKGCLNWWRLPKSNPYKCFRLMMFANGCGLFMKTEAGTWQMISGFDCVHQLQNLVLDLTETELILAE